MQLKKESLKVFLLFYIFLPLGLLLVFIIPILPYPLNMVSLFSGLAFLCIGIHELSHILAAKIKGYRIVRPIAKWYVLGFEIEPSPKREDAFIIYFSGLITCFVIPPVVLYFFGPLWGFFWFLGTLFMSYQDIKNWKESQHARTKT